MAITMKVLPDGFNTFCTVMTLKNEDCSFLDYKIALKSFKENERYCHGTVYEKDTIMQLKPIRSNPRRTMLSTCYTCGEPNHKSYQCQVNKGQSNGNQSNRKWCNNCKSFQEDAHDHSCLKQTMYKTLTLF